MWVNVNTLGTFTLHADIRYECWKSGVELPGVLTDDVLEQYGYMPVVQVIPEHDPVTQGLSAQPCVSNAGVWEQHFVPYQLDPIIVANHCQMLSEIPDSARSILQAVGRLEAAEEKAAANRRIESKVARDEAVRSILVTTAAGNTFQGDEVSQARMDRAITVLSTGRAPSVNWVLADNSVVEVDAAELTEALALAGAEQARLWVS